MKAHGTIVLIALSIGYQACTAQPENRLERLFFTPEQRANLERIRRLPSSNGEMHEARGEFTLNGEITRSNGRRIRWGNNQHIPDEVALPATLAVGDTLLNENGNRLSILGDGKIEIRRAKGKP